MGQYHIIVNLDKKEYLYPHVFGDGLKLIEFGCSGQGTLTGLTLLLSDSNGRGGGDFGPLDDNNIIGSWAKNRVVITGDYGDPYIESSADYSENNLYSVANDSYTDISEKVVRLMCKDEYIRERWLESFWLKDNKEYKKLYDDIKEMDLEHKKNFKNYSG